MICKGHLTKPCSGISLKIGWAIHWSPRQIWSDVSYNRCPSTQRHRIPNRSAPQASHQPPKPPQQNPRTLFRILPFTLTWSEPGRNNPIITQMLRLLIRVCKVFKVHACQVMCTACSTHWRKKEVQKYLCWVSNSVFYAQSTGAVISGWIYAE